MTLTVAWKKKAKVRKRMSLHQYCEESWSEYLCTRAHTAAEGGALRQEAEHTQTAELLCCNVYSSPGATRPAGLPLKITKTKTDVTVTEAEKQAKKELRAAATQPSGDVQQQKTPQQTHKETKKKMVQERDSLRVILRCDERRKLAKRHKNRREPMTRPRAMA